MESIVRAALARVLGRPVEARRDTPLAALGFDDDCWVPLACAIADARAEDPPFGDADVADVRTFGELVDMLESRSPRSPR